MAKRARASFFRRLGVRRALVAAAPFWLAAFASQGLGATTYNVTDVASLRSAINSANVASSNDIIELAAGTYLLTGAALDNANATGDLDIFKSMGNLTVRAATGATVTIDGNAVDRVFHISGGSTNTITLERLIIQNGVASDYGTVTAEARGGAILHVNGNLTLNQVTLLNSAATGITGTAGTAGTFSGGPTVATGGNGGPAGNGAPARGGAIYSDSNNLLELIQCSVSGNSANGGTGGAGGDGGSAAASQSAFGGVGGAGGNGGAAEGGAIYLASGQLALSGSTISNCSANGGTGGTGGAGGNAGGTASSSTTLGAFGGNGGAGGLGGDGVGGGLFITLGGIQAISLSTISGCGAVGGNGGDGGNGGNANGSAGSGAVNNVGGNGGDGGNSGNTRGGGIYVNGTVLQIPNSTIASNSTTNGTPGAGGTGGAGTSSGVSGSSGTVSGFSAQGGGIFIQTSNVIVDSTIFADNAAVTGPDVNGNITAGASLFETAPTGTIVPGTGANIVNQDPGLAALANNGGLTLTHAINSSSPAYNTGSNPGALTTDQRGAGFVRVSGGAPDIGAFEVQGQTAAPTVSSPAAAISINAANYNIQGTAAADSLVRIYSDLNNNGIIDGADAVVGQQALTGGATSFSVSVALTQDAANNFTATADDAANIESGPVNVPTITEDSIAPAAPAVTNPASALNTTGTAYNIQGTAENGALVQIYRDLNNNGVIDGGETVAASGTATGGNFAISTPITQGTANNFVATAEDAAGNASSPADVPTITETTVLTAQPVISTPSGSVSVDQATFNIQGTAPADSLVRVYSDANNNGIVDGADAVTGQQQLTSGATSFSISVTLAQGAANNFVATADDATNPESLAVDVPTITDTNAGGGGGGGDDSGGCSSAQERGPMALLFAGLAWAVALFRRRKASQ